MTWQADLAFWVTWSDKWRQGDAWRAAIGRLDASALTGHAAQGPLDLLEIRIRESDEI